MERNLKVLMLSSDRNILTPGSAVSLRMKEYAGLVKELHIVLLCDASHGLKDAELASNLFIHPTSSLVSFMRPLDAVKHGKKIVFEKQFVRGQSLITADSIECGWAGMKIREKWRIPLEVQFHTDPFSPYFTGIFNRVRQYFLPQVLKKADTIRVVSEELKEILIEKQSFPRNDIVVLPIFVDRSKVDPKKIMFDIRSLYPWKFIILSVARLSPEKNLGLAIDALARVKQYIPEVGLVFVGSGPEQGTLERQAKDLGVSDSVAFAGWQEALASYYFTSTIFLQTSRFEGYGLSLIEAGLAGLPVVTTPVGVANEFESGVDLLICPQDDPEFMAKTLYDLLTYDIKRKGLGVHFKQTLEQKLLSKEAYLEQLESAWQKTSLKI